MNRLLEDKAAAIAIASSHSIRNPFSHNRIVKLAAHIGQVITSCRSPTRMLRSAGAAIGACPIKLMMLNGDDQRRRQQRLCVLAMVMARVIKPGGLTSEFGT
jgi:hypothetical protein